MRCLQEVLYNAQKDVIDYETVYNPSAMGIISQFEERCLVIGVLSTMQNEDSVISLLESNWGPVSCRTESVPFSFTDYYDEEMGSRPVRFFLVFENFVSPDDLASIKIETNSIEEKFAVSKNRRINLDPGLLDLGSLILASTKYGSHRIPLRDGIFAETTLIYHTHSFHTLPWTYADYGSPQFISLFNELRTEFKRQRNLISRKESIQQ